MSPTLSILLLVLPQSGTLDQSSPMGSASFNAGISSNVWQAEIGTGLNGTLEGFDLEIQGAAGATLDVSVKLGTGWNIYSPVWSGTLTTNGTGTWEPVFVDVSSAQVQLWQNWVWVIEFNGNAGVTLRGEHVAPPGGPPYPFPLYLNGPGCFADCGWRIGFNTYIQQSTGGPILSLQSFCPNGATLYISGGTPLGQLAVVHGVSGSYVKPSNPCAGVILAIGNPTLALVIPLDNRGVRNVGFRPPPQLCGRTLQGVDLTTCRPSNTVVL